MSGCDDVAVAVAVGAVGVGASPGVGVGVAVAMDVAVDVAESDVRVTVGSEVSVGDGYQLPLRGLARHLSV